MESEKRIIESESYEEEDVENKKNNFKEQNANFLKDNLIDKESGLSIIILSKFNNNKLEHYSQIISFGKINYQIITLKSLIEKLIPKLIETLEKNCKR